jgi:GNAT superfamily N-acetyltransferase
VDGRAVTACQSFDTLTSAAFRGRGLFVRLAELAYRQISDSGCGLVYGIPNGESFGGFVRRLGWSALDPLPMMVRPVGLRYLRSRMGLRRPRHVSASVALDPPTCPADVTDLFRRSQYAGKSGVIRDREYLQWRLQRPGSSYRLIELRDARGVLNGIAVVDVVAKHGGTIGYLMELMIDPVALDDGRHLLAQALDRMVVDGADVVLAWAMPDDPVHALLRRRGFRDLPARLAPIELHLGYRSFDDANTLDRNGLRWSYLDSDTV